MEMADYVIEANHKRHPEADWLCGSVYAIPFPDASFDLCFAFYVLEHTVFPERALLEMLRVLKPGGKLILVFPDFSVSRRLNSQMLGFSCGNAAEKLGSGRVFDGLVSFYDSRVRLPRALHSASEKYGPFPVNSRPVCLEKDWPMSPDIDATYIASKNEVRDWSVTRGHEVSFPMGTTGEFKEHSLLIIAKV